jgi:hypothetical protein
MWFQKKRAETRYAEHVFFHLVRSVGHVVHSGVSGVWFSKKRTRTLYAKLVFVHPVGSWGHVVHCGTSGARNIDALFFMLWWARSAFNKKCTGTLR